MMRCDASVSFPDHKTVSSGQYEGLWGIIVNNMVDLIELPSSTMDDDGWCAPRNRWMRPFSVRRQVLSCSGGESIQPCTAKSPRKRQDFVGGKAGTLWTLPSCIANCWVFRADSEAVIRCLNTEAGWLMWLGDIGCGMCTLDTLVTFAPFAEKGKCDERVQELGEHRVVDACTVILTQKTRHTIVRWLQSMNDIYVYGSIWHILGKLLWCFIFSCLPAISMTMCRMIPTRLRSFQSATGLCRQTASRIR